MKDRLPPWKMPRAKARRSHVKLTPVQKQAAQRRAAEAGRRYPNLIDNMWAAKLSREEGQTPLCSTSSPNRRNPK